MISTGKKARKQFGTRANAKRSKRHKGAKKVFGMLPISVIRGNARGQ